MTAAARIDAVLMLLLSPFVASVLILIAVAVVWTVRVERRSNYLAPWQRDGREPGELPRPGVGES